MAKTPEKEEERKQNAPLINLHVLEEETEGKKMKSEISKRSTLFGEFPKKPRTPRIKSAESSTKLAKSESGHEENHSASLEKHTILDNKDDKEELDTQIAEKFYPSKLRLYHALKEKQSDSVKKNTILDDDVDKEEELEKMGSKRRTPQTQIAGKSRIDGKKLRKPEFGYSIDGEKLSKRPQIEKILDIIGVCSKPFEKKLLKNDVDRISFNRYDVKKGILPLLDENETAKLQKEGILVNTYDEFGNCYEMKFESYCNCFYKLCNGWERLYNYHELKENEDCYVDVWMFRHKENGGICFAVILKR